MNTVEEYIYNLPDNEQKIISFLRSIILETSPKFTEKLSYGVPYFYIHSRICFTWPASSPLATHIEGVVLGLCRGKDLSNAQGILDMGNRREVAQVIFTSVSQITEETIREIIFEAIEIDEMVYNQRKKRK